MLGGRREAARVENVKPDGVFAQAPRREVEGCVSDPSARLASAPVDKHDDLGSTQVVFLRESSSLSAGMQRAKRQARGDPSKHYGCRCTRHGWAR